MTRLIGGLLLAYSLLVVASVVDAYGCGTVVLRAPVVSHGYNYGYNYNTGYNHSIYAATFVGVPLAYPVVQVGYSNGSDQLQQQLSAVKTELEIAKLRAELQQLKAGGGLGPQTLQPQAQVPPRLTAPAPQMPPAEQASLVSTLNKCFACHDAATAQAKGGGFKMFENGASVKLTDVHALEVLKQVRTGRMPKGSTLSAAEKDIIADWVSGAK